MDDVTAWQRGELVLQKMTLTDIINVLERKYPYAFVYSIYNPQIQISAESETKRSIFREKDKTKRSKKESAQHSKSRNKSFDNDLCFGFIIS